MKGLLALIGAVFLSANLVAVHGGGGEPTGFSSTGACATPGCYPLWLIRSDGIGLEQVTSGSGIDVSEAFPSRTTVVLWREEPPSAWAVDHVSLGESSGPILFASPQKAIVVSRRSGLPTESGVVSIAPQGSRKTSGGQTASGELRYRLRSLE